MRIRISAALIVMAALVLSQAGCVHRYALQGHQIAFSGVMVDGQTGKPASGIAIAVKVGDSLIYEGAADDDGKVAFTYRYPCCHRTLFPKRERNPSEELTFIFTLDAGEHGVLEIPVRIGHGQDAFSLGSLRLISKEGL